MSSTTTALPHVKLDHIVLLLPLEQLRNPPSWLTDYFTVIPGGKHAGGVTENSLILLQDGVYIELIAFSEGVSDEQRAKHFWGKKPYGIIDYAFTISVKTSEPTDIETEFEKLLVIWREAGVDEGLIPPRLAEGGRTRPDGTKIEWKIASPQDERARGTANFWCIDVTPRNLRVPLSKETTTHPSGASGVASLSFNAPSDGNALLELSKLFGSYLKPSSSNDTGIITNSRFTIATPVDAHHAVGGGSELILTEKGVVSSGKTGAVELKLAFSTAGGESKVVRGDIEGQTVELAFV
ncbi:hypothetical protein I317_07232 [Kwoniella heveanensis CBS 569]|uniref:Glyoxalase-like domain-containing protein n=1 Tax=Kwoniella heveanensis BCC8398 TaxID=1296120 RepID=A0A1B9GKW9_9TREE|nr:hypothetical protein I316_06531 [Kwoniella heveanensis BCC8398]OCF38977.1 hypothetical protein I317_07232 [Kwoniella heveanensis CBS 569]